MKTFYVIEVLLLVCCCYPVACDDQLTSLLDDIKELADVFLEDSPVANDTVCYNKTFLQTEDVLTQTASDFLTNLGSAGISSVQDLIRLSDVSTGEEAHLWAAFAEEKAISTYLLLVGLSLKPRYAAAQLPGLVAKLRDLYLSASQKRSALFKALFPALSSATKTGVQASQPELWKKMFDELLQNATALAKNATPFVPKNDSCWQQVDEGIDVLTKTTLQQWGELEMNDTLKPVIQQLSSSTPIANGNGSFSDQQEMLFSCMYTYYIIQASPARSLMVSDIDQLSGIHANTLKKVEEFFKASYPQLYKSADHWTAEEAHWADQYKSLSATASAEYAALPDAFKE